MPIDLTKLDPKLQQKLDQLLQSCRARGVEMRAYNGLRTPAEQAKLWRQSRPIEKIRQKIDQLHAAGAHYLAGVLSAVGPASGPHVTNSIPGFSWHQWGEAVDSFWLVDGDSEWSTDRLINGLNGYQVYANEAQKLGLTAGGLWPTFKDWPHVQLQAAGSPEGAMTLQQINDEMQRRFG